MRINEKKYKLTLQLLGAIFLIIAGVYLLTAALYMPPQGEIHESVLIAFGEISTFSGSLAGIDYRYRYKLYKDKLKGNEDENEREGNRSDTTL